MKRLVAALLLAAVLLAAAALIALSWRTKAARQTTLTNGYRLELLGVVKGDQTFTTEKPWERLARNDELRLRLVDDQGYELNLERSSNSSYPDGRHIYKRDFQPRAGTTLVTLSVGISRSLSFEFFVNPAELGPTKAVSQ